MRLPSLPITAKLTPNASGLAYLLEATVLTRLASGFVRVVENLPSHQHDPRMSSAQKKQNLGERLFVEPVGTISSVIGLHLGQDFMAKLLEPALSPAKWLKDLRLDAHDSNAVRQAVADIYGSAPGMICRSLFGNNGRSVNLTAFRANLQERLGEVGGDALFEKILPVMNRFSRSLTARASGTVLFGVLTSAAIGGPVLQWINDRFVAPSLENYFEKHTDGTERRPGSQPPSQPPMTNFRPQPAFSAVSPAPSMPVYHPAPAAPAYAPLPSHVYRPMPVSLQPMEGRPQ